MISKKVLFFLLTLSLQHKVSHKRSWTGKAHTHAHLLQRRTFILVSVVWRLQQKVSIQRELVVFQMKAQEAVILKLFFFSFLSLLPLSLGCWVIATVTIYRKIMHKGPLLL